MLDVDVLADDFRAVPITSWTVRMHPSRTPLGRISLAAGRYMLQTVTGEASTHGGLREARDHAAALFSAPAAVH
jgi:hypothetical protein